MKKPLLALALMTALPPVLAADAGKQPLGAQTKAWLTLQSSGKQAASGPRPMPGEIADNVYQRYADSFKQPIPAEFKRQAADGGSNGSGK